VRVDVLPPANAGQKAYQGGEDNFGAPESVLLIEFGISRNQHLGEMVDEGLSEKVLLVDPSRHNKGAAATVRRSKQ
jgi:hypothetical protein